MLLCVCCNSSVVYAGIVRTHLLSGSIVGTRRRLRTSPEGVAPATSGVLVQVFIVLHRFAFAHGFQCQCSGCIPVVFLCARPVTPQIRNGNAQRHNARLLIASSSLCAVASSVWLFRGILCTHPLPIHCPHDLQIHWGEYEADCSRQITAVQFLNQQQNNCSPESVVGTRTSVA